MASFPGLAARVRRCRCRSLARRSGPTPPPCSTRGRARVPETGTPSARSVEAERRRVLASDATLRRLRPRSDSHRLVSGSPDLSVGLDDGRRHGRQDEQPTTYRGRTAACCRTATRIAVGAKKTDGSLLATGSPTRPPAPVGVTLNGALSLGGTCPALSCLLRARVKTLRHRVQRQSVRGLNGDTVCAIGPNRATAACWRRRSATSRRPRVSNPDSERSVARRQSAVFREGLTKRSSPGLTNLVTMYCHRAISKSLFHKAMGTRCAACCSTNEYPAET